MNKPPKDRYNAVWLIFFMLGVGTLLPWNFFMTATMYFTDRLKDPDIIVSCDTQRHGHSDAIHDAPVIDQDVSDIPVIDLALFCANLTNSSYVLERPRNNLQNKFNNVMTLCAMLPLLIFTYLNSFLHRWISSNVRISASLAAIFLFFLLTAVFVKVTFSPAVFFSVTMIKIVFINSFGAILQGSLFGLAALFPASYTAPIMSGQGLAGTFAAFSMICAFASGSSLADSAFGYFITACVVILLTLLSYFMLHKLEFYRYYTEVNLAENTTELQDKKDLLNGDDKAAAAEAVSGQPQKSSVIQILQKMWVLALSVCLVFTVTIGIFPSVTADVKSTIAGDSSWGIYFIPVSCFLLFNVCDWAGRSITTLFMWPGKDSKLLPLMVVLRLVFLLLFMFCNVQPRRFLPVLLEHDAWYICIMIIFALSNGYLASLCMCFGPKKVDIRDSERAGSIMAFFLSLGLALGAGFSFLLRILV